jgi:hypothetical protein
LGTLTVFQPTDHPKRRDLTGNRVAEIEAREDELELEYQATFKEWMEIKQRVTYLTKNRRGEWVPA